MSILEKIARLAAVVIAVVFIGISLVGIVGAWFVDRTATNVVMSAFGFVETGVGVVDAGAARVNNLIATIRTEVQQATETISAVGTEARANSPVLEALNERLETNLGPRIAQMQEALAPVREALRTTANAVSIMSSVPMMTERAPRLAALDETFNRLEELSADSTQLRNTLRALTVAQQNSVPSETVAALNRLTQRIDTRLDEVHANVRGVQADIAALRTRLDARKSKLLFVFSLLALLSTLMLAWLIYSQIVVIQHHRVLVRQSAGKSAIDEDRKSPIADS